MTSLASERHVDLAESQDKNEANTDTSKEISHETTDDFAHGARLAGTVASLMLGIFLVALDNVSLSAERSSVACINHVPY